MRAAAWLAAATLVVGGLVSVETHASDANDLVWVEYPQSGVVLGQGYNLLTDSPATGTCVDFRAVQDPSQQTSYRFDEVTSKTETMSKLNISASGSLKMAILDATASLNFLTQEEFTVDTKKFLLTADVTNSSLFAAPSFDYKLGAKNLVPFVGNNFVDNPESETPTGTPPAPVQGQPEQAGPARTSISFKEDHFKEDIEDCGHGFVAAIVSGASVQAFMTMSSEDAKSLTDIKGSVQADIGGIFSVSGSIESKQKHNSLVTRSNVSVFKSGGAGGPLTVDYEKLKTSLLNLPKEASTTPRPLRIGILPYSALSKLNQTNDVTALFFKKAVSAYFLALDVFERTSSVIDDNFSAQGLAGPARRQPFAILPFDTYLQTNTDALRLASDLSATLVLCRDEAIADAKKPPSDPARQAWQQSFAALQRVNPKQAIAQPLGGATPQSDAQRAQTLSDSFDSAITSLQSATRTAQAVQQSCNPAGFEQAVQQAIALTAREIAQRPVFFSELDATAQQEVTTAWGDFKTAIGGNLSADDLKLANETFFKRLTLVLNQHKKINVSSALFRALCANNIDNPICQFGQQAFISQTVGEANYQNLSFAALEAIGKN